MAALTDEQTILKDQASAWATEQAPIEKFREMRDANGGIGYSTETWQEIVDMGWTGILVPTEYGGADLGYLTFGIVLEELGRQLTASPLFASSLVGTSAILISGTDQQKQELLPKVVDGTELLTLAVDESPHHAPSKISFTAEEKGNTFALNGKKTFVLDGISATTFIVVARTKGASGDTHGITLFLVDANATGLSRHNLKTVDSRGYANINFENVIVSRESILGTLNEGNETLENTLDRARAGLGADMLGTAAQSFDMTLEYLKTREQFGRVIGSFQALGHRAASLFSNMELARSCAEAALQAIDDEKENASQLCSMSMVKVGDFLHEMSNQLIQIHGGIGMTDEFNAGFYLKRARVLEALYGNQAYHRDRYATLMGF
tara:strand:+ start:344 stop:1480 length:1137 start_codon:yes stop_codon:yes gene_type:complete